MLVVVGVRPDSSSQPRPAPQLGVRDAIVVDRQMRTNLPDIYAAGDCAVTYHRLLGDTYLPLGTTAHKQGRIAGENALGGHREFAGSLGTQVVKVFDLVAARTGLRDHEATAGGLDPLTVTSEADDHKAYYPGSHPITMRYTGDRQTGQLLGVQLIGHLSSEIAKRIDIAATAIHNHMTIDAISDLDLSYTPPLGSPWDALQHGAQAWTQQVVQGRSARGLRSALHTRALTFDPCVPGASRSLDPISSAAGPGAACDHSQPARPSAAISNIVLISGAIARTWFHVVQPVA